MGGGGGGRLEEGEWRTRGASWEWGGQLWTDFKNASKNWALANFGHFRGAWLSGLAVSSLGRLLFQSSPAFRPLFPIRRLRDSVPACHRGSSQLSCPFGLSDS